jgi:hypothetical protein
MAAAPISDGKGMKLPRLRWPAVFFGGLLLISFGLATSVGLQPGQALVPLLSVVGGLTALSTMMVGSGPRSLL